MYIVNSWEQVWTISSTSLPSPWQLWCSEPAPHPTLPSPPPASIPTLMAHGSRCLHQISQSVWSWDTASDGLWGWLQLEMWEVVLPEMIHFFLRLQTCFENLKMIDYLTKEVYQCTSV